MRVAAKHFAATLILWVNVCLTEHTQLHVSL